MLRLVPAGSTPVVATVPTVAPVGVETFPAVLTADFATGAAPGAAVAAVEAAAAGAEAAATGAELMAAAVAALGETTVTVAAGPPDVGAAGEVATAGDAPGGAEVGEGVDAAAVVPC